MPAQHKLQGPYTLHPTEQTDGSCSERCGQSMNLEKGGGASGCKHLSYDIFAPGAPPSPLLHKLAAFHHFAAVFLTGLMLDTFTGLVCWAPGSVALSAATAVLYSQSNWAVGWLVALSLPLSLIVALAGLCCMVAWMKANFLLWRAHGLWSKPSVPLESFRARMLGKRQKVFTFTLALQCASTSTACSACYLAFSSGFQAGMTSSALH